MFRYQGGDAYIINTLESQQLEAINPDDANVQDSDGNTALIKASKMGYIGVVRKLIADKANLDIQNRRGNTALIETVSESNQRIRDPYQDHMGVIRELIGAKANLNIQQVSGITAVQAVGVKGNQIVTHGGQISLGNTAPQYAVNYNNSAIAQALLEAKANPNTHSFPNRRTPLITAVEAQNFGMAKLLADHKADLEMQDGLQQTVLDKVTKNKQQELLNLLKGNTGKKLGVKKAIEFEGLKFELVLTLENALYVTGYYKSNFIVFLSTTFHHPESNYDFNSTPENTIRFIMAALKKEHAKNPLPMVKDPIMEILVDALKSNDLREAGLISKSLSTSVVSNGTEVKPNPAIAQVTSAVSQKLFKSVGPKQLEQKPKPARWYSLCGKAVD